MGKIFLKHMPEFVVLSYMPTAPTAAAVITATAPTAVVSVTATAPTAAGFVTAAASVFTDHLLP
jgi:hypothetical protein